MYINQDEIKGYEKNGCGIACVAMVLENLNKEYSIEKIVTFLKQGDAFIGEVGIKHDAIIRILRDNDVHSYREMFFTKDNNREFFEYGLEKIKVNLKTSLIIASVMRNFDEQEKSTHLVLLKNYSNKEFILDDPDHTFGEENRKVSSEKFEKTWSGMAIFIDRLI